MRMKKILWCDWEEEWIEGQSIKPYLQWLRAFKYLHFNFEEIQLSMLKCSNAEIMLKGSRSSFSWWVAAHNIVLGKIIFRWFFGDIDTYSSVTPSWHCVGVSCAVARATRRYCATLQWLFSTTALRCYCYRYSSDCHYYSTYPRYDSLQWCFPLNCCWFSGSLGSRRTTLTARILRKSEAIERNQWQSLRLTATISSADAPVEWR